MGEGGGRGQIILLEKWLKEYRTPPSCWATVNTAARTSTALASSVEEAVSTVAQ